MDPETATGYVAFARKAATTLVSINREWADRPRIADLVEDAIVLRMPYWMRDGYVEEIASLNSANLGALFHRGAAQGIGS